jgi:hypothetical protein
VKVAKALLCVSVISSRIGNYLEGKVAPNARLVCHFFPASDPFLFIIFCRAGDGTQGLKCMLDKCSNTEVHPQPSLMPFLADFLKIIFLAFLVLCGKFDLNYLVSQDWDI